MRAQHLQYVMNGCRPVQVALERYFSVVQSDESFERLRQVVARNGFDLYECSDKRLHWAVVLRESESHDASCVVCPPQPMFGEWCIAGRRGAYSELYFEAGDYDVEADREASGLRAIEEG